MLTVVKASLSFTGKQIFDEIGFQVEPRDRIGLVGPNGSGIPSPGCARNLVRPSLAVCY
jgi:ABC-type branched-subunit amino acid transport system ATPase component